MIVLKYLLITIEAVSSLLLIGIILLQKSKSEGLGMAFGSGMGETLFGSRAGNVLTKGTVILAVIFMVTTVALGMVFSGGSESRSLLSSSPDAVPVQSIPQQAPSAPMAAPISPAAAMPMDAAAVPVTEPVAQEPVAMPEPAAAAGTEPAE